MDEEGQVGLYNTTTSRVLYNEAMMESVNNGTTQKTQMPSQRRLAPEQNLTFVMSMLPCLSRALPITPVLLRYAGDGGIGGRSACICITFLT